MSGDRLTRGLWVAMVVVALGASACSRDKDPYADWKAPQLLDEGEKLLRARDLGGAFNFFKRGLAKAEGAGARPEQTRIFTSRMLYIAAAQANMVEAEKIFASVGGTTNPQAMDLRVALQLAILMQRAGRTDEARALAEKIALRLASKPPELEEVPFFAVGWIVVDRVRSANVELARAKEASDGFVAALSSIAEAVIGPRQPLPPGLRAWIAPYIDHLYDTERSLVAQQVADLVERIDQVATVADDKNACVLLEPVFPTLGCLADWPPK